MSDSELDRRLTAMEDRFEIGQLPIRYALAVDQRDVESWVSLFDPNIKLGRFGSGSDALRALIVPQLKWFYRSIHQIVGHRIELLPDGRAVGQVYCRAEHEVGSRWIVMAIRYDDEYQKINGSWVFSRRRERHWYAADIAEHPQNVGFDSWGTAGGPPPLPQLDVTWGGFWAGADVAAVTSAPVGTPAESDAPQA